MTDEEKQQIEQFIRIGCAAAQQGKQLEESQRIGATALHLIAKLNAETKPPTESEA